MDSNKVEVWMLERQLRTKTYIDKVCKKETQAEFIEIIKNVMSRNWKTWGWKFTFSNDYTILFRNESPKEQTFDEWLNLKKPETK